MRLWDFVIASTIVGLISFGGAKAFIPVYNQVYIHQYGFINSQQLQEYIGYSFSFPGPISPMITGLTGFFEFHILGFCLGLVALAFPPVILVLFAYLFLNRWQDSFIFQFTQKYLHGVILSLLLFVVLEFFEPYYLIAIHEYSLLCLIIVLLSCALFRRTLNHFDVAAISVVLIGVIIDMVLHWSIWSGGLKNCLLFFLFTFFAIVFLHRWKIHPLILMIMFCTCSILLWNL